MASSKERRPEREARPTESASEQRALVDAMIANRGEAWQEFKLRYDRILLRCIARVTRRFAAASNDDVREIYAQLQLSLVAHDKAKLRAFDPARGSRLSSYVGMLAIHCAHDSLRTLRRRPACEALAAELPSSTPDPFEQTAQQEHAKLAARVLAGLSERDRTFAALYFVEGMTPHDIASSMKISLKTVYTKKHKIRSKLESIVAHLHGVDLAA